MELCSAGYYAISNNDLGTLEAVAEQIPKKNTEIEALASQRQQVLKELGY
jgi:hypothetical protein